MEIYFIRHTQVNLEQDTCYGQSNIGLAETFESELNNIRKIIPNSISIDIYTSPLKRCVELAKKLTNNSLILDDRLLELDFGEWELKKWNSIDKMALKSWTNNYLNIPCPNGESYMDLYDRSIEFFDDLIKKGENDALVVTHAGVIRSIISYILKIPLENSFSVQLDFGSVSKISINHIDDCNPIFKIEFLNKL